MLSFLFTLSLLPDWRFASSTTPWPRRSSWSASTSWRGATSTSRTRTGTAKAPSSRTSGRHTQSRVRPPTKYGWLVKHGGPSPCPLKDAKGPLASSSPLDEASSLPFHLWQKTKAWLKGVEGWGTQCSIYLMLTAKELSCKISGCSDGYTLLPATQYMTMEYIM